MSQLKKRLIRILPWLLAVAALAFYSDPNNQPDGIGVHRVTVEPPLFTLDGNRADLSDAKVYFTGSSRQRLQNRFFNVVFQPPLEKKLSLNPRILI
jgi:hypothetical protein